MTEARRQPEGLPEVRQRLQVIGGANLLPNALVRKRLQASVLQACEPRNGYHPGDGVHLEHEPGPLLCVSCSVVVIIDNFLNKCIRPELVVAWQSRAPRSSVQSGDSCGLCRVMG